jgi:hypothetical protein
MLIVYEKSTGKIIALASTINENGVKREPSKSEIYPHLVGESLYVPDTDNLIENSKNYFVENGELKAIVKTPINVTGIPEFITPNSSINLLVAVEGYSGKLQISVSRGKLSSREIDIINGHGSFTFWVPDETIDISMNVFSKDDVSIQAFQTVLQVG